MTQKIVHKLNKETRQDIARHYVSDYFSKELTELNSNVNATVDKILNDIYKIYPKEKIDSIDNFMSTFNFDTDNRDGALCGDAIEQKPYRRTPVELKIYTHNNIIIEPNYNEHDSLRALKNQNMSPFSLCFVPFVENNHEQELLELQQDIKQLIKNIRERFKLCYELLSKVRTAELLMKHWSKAYKYLPENMEIEEPNKLSLSERFQLL